ncbi:MAG: insulinase family protein [Clostridia bacterium]|nr:insulinase family protein [Clostridia bacterium]
MPINDISKTQISENVFLHYINDKKHKTDYCHIYFSFPATEESVTKAELLKRVLIRGSKEFPTQAALNEALDMNYASAVSFSTAKESDKIAFVISLSTMKEAFAMRGERIFERALYIAMSLLKNPLTENGGFLNEYMESEKRNQRDDIRSQINNKGVYSKIRFISKMFEGEPYAINPKGSEEILEGLDGVTLYRFLLEILSTADCNIFFVGEVDQGEVLSLFKGHFENVERRVPKAIPSFEKRMHTPPVTFEESLDINQSHLWFGFRAPVLFSHPDYLKFALFNMVLGGDVSSRMFMNIREKLSLCYTCYSGLDGARGALFAYAGIDKDNFEKTKEAFFRELEKIRAGEIDESELDDAKRAFANRMREIEDNPSYLAPWLYPRLNTPRLPERDAEEIQKLGVSDVVEAAGLITLDTIYFLTSRGDV